MTKPAQNGLNGLTARDRRATDARAQLHAEIATARVYACLMMRLVPGWTGNDKLLIGAAAREEGKA